MSCIDAGNYSVSKKQQKPRLSRRKGMSRKSRLQAARAWIPAYTGKNLVRGYRKHFGVDLLCAIRELQLLGIKIEQSYIDAVKASIAENQKRKAEKKQKQRQNSTVISDERFAFIAGYTSWGFPYGITWEEMEDEESEDE